MIEILISSWLIKKLYLRSAMSENIKQAAEYAININAEALTRRYFCFFVMVYISITKYRRYKSEHIPPLKAINIETIGISIYKEYMESLL